MKCATYDSGSAGVPFMDIRQGHALIFAKFYGKIAKQNFLLSREKNGRRSGGGAGWEARTAERETKKLVERGLLRPYHFNGEYEITDAGRAAYDALTLA